MDVNDKSNGKAALAELAKGGDVAAARLLLERSIAPLRAAEEAAPMDLPDGSLTDQGQAVVKAIAAGELTPAQGAALIASLGTLANPSKNLWEVNAVESKPKFVTDDDGNKVIEEVQTPIKDARTISFKDGGREVHIWVKDARLREQLQNLDAVQPGALVGLALAANRMQSRMYTALSPTFTVLNALRDVQAAAVGMIDSTGFKGSAKMLLNLPHAYREAAMAELGKPSAEYQEYRLAGGKTGFYDFKSIDGLAKDLQQKMTAAERFRGDPRTLASGALALIEKTNGAVENATRFAAYRAARSEGKTIAEASSISKNITINFNRKGTWSNGLSAWFLFYNPSVQGSARIVQSLKSPKVLATLGAGMSGIAMLAMRNVAMGDDDDGVAWWDKIPDETKERNLIIMLPPNAKAGEAVPGSRIGRYLKIPMPYGYNVFAVIANQAVDVWRHSQDPKRGRSAVDGAMKTLNAFLGAWLPSNDLARAVDNPKAAVVGLTPNVLHPIVQAEMNVNSFGRKMYPDDERSQNLPDSTKFFPTQAGTLFQKAAEKLNSATGGSSYRPGLVDITPATLDLIAHTFGGGPVAFGLDLMNAVYARQSIKRPDVDLRRLPFAKQLYGQIDAESDRMVAYDRMDKAQQAVDPFERAARDGASVEAKKLLADSGPIALMGGQLLSIRQSLSEIRKQELSVIGSTTLTDDAKFQRLQKIDERKRLVLQNLNRSYDRAIELKAKNDARANSASDAMAEEK